MSFRAERKRLRDSLDPGEEILASDPLCAIEERPELTVLSHPVLVVTDRSIYVVLSGREREVTRIAFDELAGVRRTERPVPGSTLQLTMSDGRTLTMSYEPRSRRHDTADLISRRVPGPVVEKAGEESPLSDQ